MIYKSKETYEYKIIYKERKNVFRVKSVFQFYICHSKSLLQRFIR